MPTLRRLDQALAARGYGSRKEIAALVRVQRVKVNGTAAQSSSQKIDLELDGVTVDGQAVRLQEFIYIMLHKPQDVLSASRDSHAPTVLALLPKHLRRRGLFPVGRLDKDTTGLLLITDDGPLAHALLSPRRHVPKRYLAELRCAVTEADIAAFAQGLHLPPCEGHPAEDCLPAQLIPLTQPGAARNLAQVVLQEGKYHQIKRMFSVCGNEVLALHREAMGTLQLEDTLSPGECRELRPEELQALRQAIA